MRISGPFEHKSLAVYFLHDDSRGGPVPLTLQEALLKGDIRIDETGNVHELVIDNVGDSDVFIQAGDIVKGGRQDRVLGVSMLVPARSGRVPIASFCVESGRWSRRGFEDAHRFSRSDNLYSAPRAKAALRRSASSYSAAERKFATASYAALQGEVWDEVATTQRSLMAAVGPGAVAAASPTSLELSMEQEAVQAARADFLAALGKAGEADQTITGAVFAVSGTLRSAEAYPWSGLFRKMWAKNLGAGVTEALRGPGSQPAAVPGGEAALAFLREAQSGEESEHPLPLGARLRQRVAARFAFLESLKADGAWVHRSYVAQ